MYGLGGIVLVVLVSGQVSASVIQISSVAIDTVQCASVVSLC